MADEENKVTDPQGQSTTTTDPSESKDGESTTETKIPEKLQGKTVEDIARMYTELEKTYGKHSQEVNTYRKKVEEWETLGRVIKGNPELEKQLVAEIEKISGKSTETTSTNGEKPRVDDTRKAVESTIISTFEKNYGIDRLPGERKTELFSKIADELGDMLDPGGNKNMRQILNEISLEKLPKYLEKAYKLATMDDVAEQGRVKGLAEARMNSEAAFGSIPSSGGNSNKIELTPKQQEVARRMGISEEKYIANLRAIQEEV